MKIYLEIKKSCHLTNVNKRPIRQTILFHFKVLFCINNNVKNTNLKVILIFFAVVLTQAKNKNGRAILKTYQIFFF